MGLFNRGSKSDVPLSGDEWSPNGGPHTREATPEPAETERAPAPERDPENASEAQETPAVQETTPPLTAEEPQGDPDKAPDPEPDPEPEPAATTERAHRG
jgi:hypothetical protein